VHENGTRIASWIVNILMAELKEQTVADLRFDGDALGHLVALLDADTIGTPAAKRVFATLLTEGGDPRQIVSEQGLEQISDPATIGAIVDEVMGANPGQVNAYRGGKTKLLGFFVGQVMGRTQGKANPQIVRTVLAEKLNA
jgi:Asp-tRNA(Asn)/Glu-tRNA(Gln) amidotransferase B subunit